ncbi:T-lymphocyte activation antigen CD80 [Danio aesculapii]|uniref:T-lymphocyte activation antigen CD80 n=1 Tax=Danio aesculapii TaxID=1142201 RepID=UPI0024C00F47|nr:T-lymphocyte activation antigen CD80 [Danio aesculapii]
MQFVNGFDTDKELEVSPEYQDRTEVNKTELSMEMRNIKTSDEGLYQCLVFYSTASAQISRIYLKVTGEKISAVLGRSVTFRCTWNLSIPVYKLYIQKPELQPLFINGFDLDKELQVSPEYRDRTEVNKAELSMEMRNVTVSDEGPYECVVFSSTTSPDRSKIYLMVTAEFSTPSVEAECGERNPEKGRSCQMSCGAGGGYPRSDVIWAGLNQSMMIVLNDSSSEDSTYKTWSINQTIKYTCERPVHVSCEIGGAVSHTITICESAPLGFDMFCLGF